MLNGSCVGHVWGRSVLNGTDADHVWERVVLNGRGTDHDWNNLSKGDNCFTVE